MPTAGAERHDSQNNSQGTWTPKIGDIDLATNEGEQVFDALLLLGYTIEINDAGSVTATKGTDVLHGNAESGTIVWSDRSLIYQVLRDAYIARLRLRVQAAQASLPPPLE